MSTFGRVLGVLGLALAGAGAIGAIAIMPPPALTRTADYVEEKRVAIRAHLPEVPPLQELLTGSGGDGAEACSQDGAGGEGAPDSCGTAAPKVLGRGAGTGNRFRAPTAPAGN